MHDRVFGVDFSGAADAGNNIWIAGGKVDGTTLRLDQCQCVASLPNSGKERDHALKALRAFVRQAPPCMIGMDFPFGLPALHVKQSRWEDFVADFRSRYQSAEAFQAKCHAETSKEYPRRKELRRATDIETKTPQSPYNRRLFVQTYYGIRDVLAPLVEDGTVSVLPMQPAFPGRVWLVEICPASTLKYMELYQPYKGPEYAAVRGMILDELQQREDLVVLPCIRDQASADKNGDALDSIIAAVATYRVAREGIGEQELNPVSRLEGFVYV